MSKNRNFKKGFSLVEALIALTLIALIFATATTAIVSTVNNRRYTEVKRFFINETQNYLECYKRGGKDGFRENLKNLLDIDKEPETDSTHDVYKIYYSRTFEVVSSDEGYFEIVVRIEPEGESKGFWITVYEVESTKMIYKTETPYVSRFDMQGA